MIKIVNGFKEYKGVVNKVALKNINLSFAQNGLVVIYGPSGSGKTTLLNCISGLDTFTSGEINKCDKTDIGFVFQDYALIDNLSIYDNLRIINDCDEKNEEVLSIVKIDEPINKKINQLSGGQKQIIAIARALLANRKVIIADEPTGNLDFDNSRNIAQLLKELAKDKLIIVVTHDYDLFKDYADRLIKLVDGEINQDIVVNEGKKLTESFKDDKSLKLSFSSVWKLFLSGGKIGISKLITGIIILSLAGFTVLSMINVLTTDYSDMLLKAAKEYNLNIISFKASDKNGLPISFAIDDYNKLNEITDDYAILHANSYPSKIFEMEFDIENIYETSEIKNQTLAGSNELHDGGVILSNKIAKMIMNYGNKKSFDDLLGLTLNINNYPVTIIGIDEKIKLVPNRGDFDYYQDLYNDEANYCYMNSNTYQQIVTNVYQDSYGFNTNDFMNNKIYNDGAIDDLLVSLGKSELKNDEIILNQKEYRRLCGDYEIDDLLDKNFDFVFKCNNEYQRVSLKIVGFGNYTVVNEETFRKMYFYSNEYYNLTSIMGVGIFTKNLSTKMVNELLENNIKSTMFLEENVVTAKGFSKMIGNVMIIVVIPMILISILYLLSYAKQNIIAKRREIGIFKSLGFSNKEISKIFVLDSFLLIMISLMISLIITPLGINLINGVLSSNIIMFTAICYNPLYIFFLLFVMIIIFVISLLTNLYKLNKKSDVDLVYER